LLDHAAELEVRDRVSKRRFFYRGDESCRRTEVLRYQQQLDRLPVGKNILVAFDGGERDAFDTTLLFKPPFGPYLWELKETFPIGPSEIPEWDEAMVRQGCRGIRLIQESHPESRITVSCSPRWEPVIREVLGDIGVTHDPS
jgi:7-cyano-7-deazaguanine tRNA-ribosyltransferase